jgi:hypothetical protein
MKLTCECGKVLHADECGFRNTNCKDVLLYLCPYCGAKTTSFIPSTPEEAGSVREIMPGLEFIPEQSGESLDERIRQFFHKITQRNDAASGERLGSD